MIDTITPDEALELAQNDGTPVEVLTLLATRGERVRAAVAQNASTPVEVLGLLAGDGDHKVRQVVANNGGTPALLLMLLAHDSNESVRWIAARRLLSPADRVTFDALKADGWNGTLDELLDTVAALAAA